MVVSLPGRSTPGGAATVEGGDRRVTDGVTDGEPGVGRSRPAHVALLVAFTNSVDHDEGTDDLTTPAELSRWVVAHGLAGRGVRASAADLDLALRLRDALHRAFEAHHDAEEDGGDLGGSPPSCRCGSRYDRTAPRSNPSRAASEARSPGSSSRWAAPPQTGRGAGSRSARRATAAGRTTTRRRTGRAAGASGGAATGPRPGATGHACAPPAPATVLWLRPLSRRRRGAAPRRPSWR